MGYIVVVAGFIILTGFMFYRGCPLHLHMYPIPHYVPPPPSLARYCKSADVCNGGCSVLIGKERRTTESWGAGAETTRDYVRDVWGARKKGG